MGKLLLVATALAWVSAGGAVRAQGDGVSRHWLQLQQRRQATDLGVAQELYRWRYGEGLGERDRQRLERDLARQRSEQRQLFDRQERDRMVRSQPPSAPGTPTGDSPAADRQRALRRQLYRQQQQQLRLHQELQRRGWRSLP